MGLSLIHILFHIPIFMIVLGVTEGSFLLPQLLPALAVDVRWRGRSVVRWCIIRHLLHSTAKAHNAVHKITAVVEIHAQVMIFFCAVCSISES